MLLLHFSDWVSPMTLQYTELSKDKIQEHKDRQGEQTDAFFCHLSVLGEKKLMLLYALISATDITQYSFIFKINQILFKPHCLEFHRYLSPDRYHMRSKTKMWCTCLIHSFTHSFILQIFSEQLLCAKHSSGSWRYREETQALDFTEITFLSKDRYNAEVHTQYVPW